MGNFQVVFLMVVVIIVVYMLWQKKENMCGAGCGGKCGAGCGAGCGSGCGAGCGSVCNLCAGRGCAGCGWRKEGFGRDQIAVRGKEKAECHIATCVPPNKWFLAGHVPDTIDGLAAAVHHAHNNPVDMADN